MRHALAFDCFNELFWVKTFVENIGGADVHGGHQSQKRAVENYRARMQDDALRSNAISGSEERAIHGADVMCMHNSLGLPGGATAVNNVVEIVAGDFDSRRALV